MYLDGRLLRQLGTPVCVAMDCRDHWRKNTPVLGKSHRTYAIDLLGYGFSDKPNPREAPQNTIYCFDNWGHQIVDFIKEQVGGPAFVITNSVGGMQVCMMRHLQAGLGMLACSHAGALLLARLSHGSIGLRPGSDF